MMPPFDTALLKHQPDHLRPRTRAERDAARHAAPSRMCSANSSHRSLLVRPAADGRTRMGRPWRALQRVMKQSASRKPDTGVS